MGRSTGNVPADRRATGGGAVPPLPTRPLGRYRGIDGRSLLARRWPDRGVLRLAPGADRYPVVLGAGAVGRPSRRPGARAVPVGGRGAGPRAPAPPRRGARRRSWPPTVRGRRRRGSGPARRRGGPACVVGARAAAWAPAPRSGPGRRPRRARRGVPAGAGPDLARPRRRDRAGPAGRRAVPAGVAVPVARGAGVGRADRPTDRAPERAAWPRIEVVDQRELDPRSARCSRPGSSDLLRSDRRVVCILNRTGRARLLACTSCATLARCAVCDAAVHQIDGPTAERPGSAAGGAGPSGRWSASTAAATGSRTCAWASAGRARSSRRWPARRWPS